MAYGRVNVGGTAKAKEINVKETLQASGNDTTTEYELIKIQTDKIGKILNLDGKLEIKNKYTSEEQRHKVQLFLNNTRITYQSITSSVTETQNRYSTLVFKNFSIVKTNNNFNVSIIFNAYFEMGSKKSSYYALIPYNVTLPLTTTEIKLTSKADSSYSNYDGIIEKDYNLYTI